MGMFWSWSAVTDDCRTLVPTGRGDLDSHFHTFRQSALTSAVPGSRSPASTGSVNADRLKPSSATQAYPGGIGKPEPPVRSRVHRTTPASLPSVTPTGDHAAAFGHNTADTVAGCCCRPSRAHTTQTIRATAEDPGRAAATTPTCGYNEHFLSDNDGQRINQRELPRCRRTDVAIIDNLTAQAAHGSLG
jgi:hypothetical protein